MRSLDNEALAGAGCCAGNRATPQKSSNWVTLRAALVLGWGAVATPWGMLAVIGAILLAFDPSQFPKSLIFVAEAAWSALPFVAASIGLAAYIRAAGADTLVSRVFAGNPVRMIFGATFFGAFSPFCSCGVIPVIAGLLRSGVPLAPIMAFWIASPSMDPELFILIAGTLGLEFAIVKTLAVIILSLAAGFITLILSRYGFASEVLRAEISACCGSPNPAAQTPIWKIWQSPDRRALFAAEAAASFLFLSKWLLLAFMLESLMVRYVPAELILGWLGNDYWGALPLAALLGVPAYLNTYASIPLVEGLMKLGMSPAVGLTFMLAGTITSLPAAIAVWVTVRPRVFALYILTASIGAMIAGLAYQAYLAA